MNKLNLFLEVIEGKISFLINGLIDIPENASSKFERYEEVAFLDLKLPEDKLYIKVNKYFDTLIKYDGLLIPEVIVTKYKKVKSELEKYSYKNFLYIHKNKIILFNDDEIYILTKDDIKLVEDINNNKEILEILEISKVKYYMFYILLVDLFQYNYVLTKEEKEKVIKYVEEFDNDMLLFLFKNKTKLLFNKEINIEEEINMFKHIFVDTIKKTLN